MIIVDLIIILLIVLVMFDDDIVVDFCVYGEFNCWICDEQVGFFDLVFDVVQFLLNWQDDVDLLDFGFIVCVDGEIVGMVMIFFVQEEEVYVVEIDFFVFEDCWGYGIEDVLFLCVEIEVCDCGCSVLQIWLLYCLEEVEWMFVLKMGWGWVFVIWLSDLIESCGFIFEQVECNSEVDFCFDFVLLCMVLIDVFVVVGFDYWVFEWMMLMLFELWVGFVVVFVKLLIDVFSGDMDFVVEVWDEDCVVWCEVRLIGVGQIVFVVVVQYVLIGDFVVYNELLIGVEWRGVMYQFGILVLKEYCGYWLGMIVKCVNFFWWCELMLDVIVVLMFNVEEN